MEHGCPRSQMVSALATVAISARRFQLSDVHKERIAARYNAMILEHEAFDPVHAGPTGRFIAEQFADLRLAGVESATQLASNGSTLAGVSDLPLERIRLSHGGSDREP